MDFGKEAFERDGIAESSRIQRNHPIDHHFAPLLDICRHMSNLIARAEKEVFFWPRIIGGIREHHRSSPTVSDLNHHQYVPASRIYSTGCG